MRALLTLAVSGLTAAALTLGGCGSNGAAGISTASLLDGKSAAGDATGIKNDDPTAKPVQVALTAARAQKCGFNFDASRLKANYLASEARTGAQQPQLASIEKTYDSTFATVSANIKGEADYCNDRKTAVIKSDLQRHLAGNYEPNLPKEQKKVASGGFFDGLISDEPVDTFNSKTFWADQAARKDGAKSAQ